MKIVGMVGYTKTPRGLPGSITAVRPFKTRPEKLPIPEPKCSIEQSNFIVSAQSQICTTNVIKLFIPDDKIINAIFYSSDQQPEVQRSMAAHYVRIRPIIQYVVHLQSP